MASIVENLPNEPIWHLLLKALTSYPHHIIVDDAQSGLEADYTQLVTDMLHMRREILKALPPSMLDCDYRIIPQRPYITIIAPGNLDYIVAAFAVLSIGGAFAPIASNLLPEEASHLIKMTDSTCILASPRFMSKATQIQKHHAANGRTTVVIPIQVQNTRPDRIPQIQIDQTTTIDPMSPGALIFTSGTTGPPKGVVRPRRVWYIEPPAFPSNQVFLNSRSPHAVGVALRLIWNVQRGSRIQLIEDSSKAIWERFRKGDVTLFSAAPPEYVDLMTYFKDNIDGLPAAERAEYVEGVRRLNEAAVSGGVTWPPVMAFWRDILGRPLVNVYSSTEVTTAMQTSDDTDSTLERCIGNPRHGVQVKLSEGDHGEILLQSPDMFTHYLGEEDTTRAAFDEDGYYKSGDFGHRVGDQYVFDGRASTDWIRRGGLKVQVHEVEASLVSLPYVSEAYVVSAVLNYRNQIATLIRLRATGKLNVNLSMVRADLAEKLNRYKLPTLLRVLQAGEVVPQTSGGKPSRRKIVEEFFTLSEESLSEAGVEFHNDTDVEGGAPRKLWDWGGL
ncbi:hypothetical protein BDV28DRAFT_149241 [Aspergillus coremiiformis]|uniref:AMP-dependent synthetase/ligase domain-containing protein n=1 Tax=Aspergillus coremiiformis TaxID=138285 RepID=A0A5N6Z5P1_9EURO|nr:hypothetical protein BDV28DRAFT_149241 [Aspergillus coremiiformis]